MHYQLELVRYNNGNNNVLATREVTADKAIQIIIDSNNHSGEATKMVVEKPEPTPKPKVKKTTKKKPGRKPRAHYDTDAIVADLKAGMANKDIAQKHNVPIQVVYKVKHQNKAALKTAPAEEKTDEASEVPFHFTRALELRQQGYNAEAVRHKLNDYATYDQITDALDWADSQL